jgi:hypothetical protein
VSKELSFDNYRPWFESLSSEARKRVARAGLAPDVVDSGLETVQSRGLSERKFRKDVEYRAWIASLAPEDRADLERAGITGPDDDFSKVDSNPGFEDDPASTSLASCEPAEFVESERDELCEALDLSPAQASLVTAFVQAEVAKATAQSRQDDLQIVVSLLLETPNVRIAAAGLAFAADLAALNGLGSQNEYAEKIGFSRSAISKSVRQWKSALGLRTNGHMKSDEAVEKYKHIAKTDHWRNKKFDPEKHTL